MKWRKEKLADEIKPLRKLAESIREEIKAQRPDQGGQNVEERGQRENDVAALRDRLEMIEREAEKGAKEIKDRYSDPQAWVFPVSMTIIYPRDISHMF